MDGVTLRDALERVEISGTRERSEAIADLKHVLRHHQRNARASALSDLSLHRIFEILFRVAITDQSAYVKAKTGTLKSAAANRLSSYASALRLAIEVGVTSIRLKTVRALVDHILQTLFLASGDLCEPLASDYAKCLRTILSYQPHVEHLPRAEWERTADFCVKNIRFAQSEASAGSTQNATASHMSILSSRSHQTTSSQGGRSVAKQIAEEMVTSLQLLTAAPNAPMADKAVDDDKTPKLLWTMIGFLKSSSASSRSQQDGFAVVNNILTWSQTENIGLVKQATIPLVRLVRVYWSSKSSALKDEMLLTLINLRLYIRHLARQPGAAALKTETSSLLDAMVAEYTQRKEREQLHMDDVHLNFTAGVEPGNEHGAVACCLMSLRCLGVRSEHNWMAVSTMAFFVSVLKENTPEESSSDEEDEGRDDRPRKKQRTSSELDEVLHSTQSGSPQSRTTALQMLTFLAQQTLLSPDQLNKVLENFLVSCNEENGNTASWALLAVTSCATQVSSTHPTLSGRWDAVWQLACRLLSNASTSRSAAHLLNCMVHLKLVTQAPIAEFMQSLAVAIELSGPALICDSALQLLHTVAEQAPSANPGSAHLIADSVISWTLRRWTSSKFDDRAYAALCNLHQASDIVDLAASYLGQESHLTHTVGCRVWESVGVTYLRAQSNHNLVSYLLSLPRERTTVNPTLATAISGSRTTSSRSPSKSAAEPLLLTHLSSELTKATNSWTQQVQDRPGGISTDAFASLCTSAAAGTCIAYCFHLVDERRRTRVQKSCQALLRALSAYVANVACDQDKVDIMLSTFAGMFWSSDVTNAGRESEEGCTSACQTVLCSTITEAINAKSSQQESNNDVDDDDLMEIGPSYDSQESRQATNPAIAVELTDEWAVAYSSAALRASVPLYASVVTIVTTTEHPSSGDESVSALVVDKITLLADTSILTSRSVLERLPDLIHDLSAADTDRFLELLTERILNAYAFERSEVAIGAIVDIMTSLKNFWTDSANKNLFDLGLDMYTWCTSTALKAGVLSPIVQKKLGSLLIHLCHVDTDYGHDDDVPSVRTSLFQLLQLGTISVQYYLAEKISTIFSLFVLSAHEPMFDDLQNSLANNINWTEGMAMRLLFLAKLASSWPSLLRRSVYYIFEMPGLMPTALSYASYCVQEVAKSLHFKSPQKLFRLFAPQLLFSWLIKHSLASLPYAVFSYSTLKELAEHNRDELAAMLHLHGADEGMGLMRDTLGVHESELLKQAFGKSLAYAMASDIEQRKSADQGLNCEGRLRNVVGGKEEFKRLTMAQFPVVMGHFYLCINQEDVEDKWLEKRHTDARTAKVLTEMKGYSHSTRAMPPSQEPCFKAVRLGDQIERLCRRANTESSAVWDQPSFTIAARILLDSVDDSLGSLHICTMLRKLRVLIAAAGDVATTGYPLEMLLRSVRSFLSDSECADDTIGILRYLLQHGQEYLSANASFLCGVTCTLILQMRKHMGSKHDSTTQESQHMSTVQKMQSFYTWLIQILKQRRDTVDTRYVRDYDIFIQVISHIELPGNARKGSSESELILLLARQQRSAESLIGKRDVMESLSMLARGFQLSSTAAEDALGDDRTCMQYVPHLWWLSRACVLDDPFLLWIANAAGRAYAASGSKELFLQMKDNPRAGKASAHFAGVQKSQALIAERLCDILSSSSRSDTGLAEYTLQIAASNVSSKVDPNEVLAFEHSLPPTVFSSLGHGTYGYTPPTAPPVHLYKDNNKALQQALTLDAERDLGRWALDVALVLCQWPSASPIIGSLSAILDTLPHLAKEWLPCMVHIVLTNEIDHEQTVRKAISKAMSAHLASELENYQPKQRYLLEVLLFLRQQPYPREATKVDRLRWLDTDNILAAKVASHCGMPTLALMLAETAPPAEQPDRRASSRVSLPSGGTTNIPDELLLSIFEQVDEPDSFYGVTQPATLSAVLNRLDYEKNGFRSLMFRSAQVDNNMRRLGGLDASDKFGMIKSLSNLNLNSLTFALTSGELGGAPASANEMLDSARRLQQWDIAMPESQDNSPSRLMKVFQDLSTAHDRSHALNTLQKLTLSHANTELHNEARQKQDLMWYNTLGVLAELQELVSSAGQKDTETVWRKMQARQEWMGMARFEDFEILQQSRQTVFSVVGQNKALLEDLHTEPKTFHIAKAQALLSFSELARKHGQLQHALGVATQASDLATELNRMGLHIEAAARHEVASVLWASGEETVSVNVLRDVLRTPDLDKQTIPVGRSGLLAQLGQQLADARLEKPGDILESYLKPAISQLSSNKHGREAGKVFHAFASFCDQQLQHPANVEDFNRIAVLRQRKMEEVEGLAELVKSLRKGSEKDQHHRTYQKANQWFKLDNEEYQKQKQSREQFLQQSLQNYLMALQASSEHDICVLRFFALWLENAESAQANNIVHKYLPSVPSWKFVVLLNQLMSRLEDDETTFQKALRALTLRMATQHPYHCVHHIYASTIKPENSDEAANSRYQAAEKIRSEIMSDEQRNKLFQRLLKADDYYRDLAEEPVRDKKSGKRSLNDIRMAAKVAKRIPELRLPPVTISIPLRPDGNYRGLAEVTKFVNQVRIMSGLSTPKVLTAIASDGRSYNQLFKSGNDDLRQDAIMEQVFDEVSKMLQKHKATRQRNLHIRTYKVIPTSNTSGIIEFVANSIPIGDFLTPAHAKYYPKDVNVNTARDAIRRVDSQSPEARVKEYRRVCDHLHPILRHFFLERFDDPDDWFEKRTAYTRTTASVSMLGHVLGLGDRHCSNIMLDEKTGEVVHIDLGVAFEAGRILPIPELVPFRLTRDIIDGMGVTKTEGVFRRCCEFTMDALREDKDSIMTLLNVLRYDPLYTWTLSPIRAKRMQDASDGGHNANDVEAAEGSKKKEQEAGEADRALAIVEKKLSKSLSTAATVNELIQQATDETNLATLFAGWMAYL